MHFKNNWKVNALGVGNLGGDLWVGVCGWESVGGSLWVGVLKASLHVWLLFLYTS